MDSLQRSCFALKKLPSDALSVLAPMKLKYRSSPFTKTFAELSRNHRLPAPYFSTNQSKFLDRAMLTSKLLLPVAGNLTLLSLGGLFALSSSASALTCPQATVTIGGHTDAPLPFPTVRLLCLFLWMKTRNQTQAREVVSTQSLWRRNSKLD